MDGVDMPDPMNESMKALPLWWMANLKSQGQNEVRFPSSSEASGGVVLPYTPPHPQQGTGFHRYAWLALEQKDVVDVQEVLVQWNQVQWDVQAFLASNSAHYVPRGLCFHRAAWTRAVTDMYVQGQIRVAPHVASSLTFVPGKVQPEVADAEEFVVLKQEPVFGRVAERDWETVVRQLNRYAFL